MHTLKDSDRISKSLVARLASPGSNGDIYFQIPLSAIVTIEFFQKKKKKKKKKEKKEKKKKKKKKKKKVTVFS